LSVSKHVFNILQRLYVKKSSSGKSTRSNRTREGSHGQLLLSKRAHKRSPFLTGHGSVGARGQRSRGELPKNQIQRCTTGRRRSHAFAEEAMGPYSPWGERTGQTRSRRRSASLTSPAVNGAPTMPDFHVALGPLTVTYRLSFLPRSALPLHSSHCPYLSSASVLVSCLAFPCIFALESKRNQGCTELDWGS
jgi:hypothetical protein